MKIKVRSILILGFLFVFSTSCGEQNKRSKVLDDFEKNKPKTVKSFYAYPSTVRMLAKILESDNPESFVGINEARLFISWKDDEHTDEVLFDSLITELKAKESFEELMTLRSQETNISIQLREGKIPVYVILAKADDLDYLLEIDGDISLKTLQELGTMDMSQAFNILDLGQPKKPESSSDTTKVES